MNRLAKYLPLLLVVLLVAACASIAPEAAREHLEEAAKPKPNVGLWVLGILLGVAMFTLAVGGGGG